ncbi:hypothetical protein CHI14_09595 [Paenibacillus sp. 7516]|nr:hypothetical protein CHI14_09595 [Paenibacillus sp. 7516]
MDYAPEGDITRFDPEDIADAVEWQGEADLLLKSLLDVGFIDEIDGMICIHDWFDYAGRLVEKREKNNERKRKSRLKQKENEGHAPVTRDGGVTDAPDTGLPNQHNQHNQTEPNQPNLTEPQPTQPENENMSGSISEIIELNPYRVFEQEGFGTISPVIKDQMEDMIVTYGSRWVCEAMKKAVVSGKRRVNYVEGILKNWKADGIDEPWTKEPPPSNNGGKSYGRGGKPNIQVVQPVTDPNESDISEEEHAAMMKFAAEQMAKKAAGGVS